MKLVVVLSLAILTLPDVAKAGFFDSSRDLAGACALVEKEPRNEFEACAIVACLGYMNGFWHGYYQGGNGTTAGGRICWPRNVNPTQMASAYARFFQSNPDKQGNGLYELVDAALVAAFPCEK